MSQQRVTRKKFAAKNLAPEQKGVKYLYSPHQIYHEISPLKKQSLNDAKIKFDGPPQKPGELTPSKPIRPSQSWFELSYGRSEPKLQPDSAAQEGAMGVKTPSDKENLQGKVRKGTPGVSPSPIRNTGVNPDKLRTPKKKSKRESLNISPFPVSPQDCDNELLLSPSKTSTGNVNKKGEARLGPSYLNESASTTKVYENGRRVEIDFNYAFTVETYLTEYKLDHLIPLFKGEVTDVGTLASMTEADFRQIGVHKQRDLKKLKKLTNLFQDLETDTSNEQSY